jgi:hypothetical protein
LLFYQLHEATGNSAFLQTARKAPYEVVGGAYEKAMKEQGQTTGQEPVAASE